MSFLSISFITFFIIVLIGLYWAPSRHLRHRLLLAASLWFYATWGFVYLPVLVVPMVISYFCGVRIEDSTEPTARRRWLTVGIGLNLLLLTYYKYADFFLENVRLTTGAASRGVGIVLPLGISFFTFKALSYIIDVYRQDVHACRSFWQYATFVCYFPDLIAGPLVRVSLFLPQMNRSLRPSWPRTSVGCQMILLGITKKLLIADQMALFVDPVFARADLYSPLTVWSAVIAYSLQIYCDFSGYSDMAIGISKIIGIDLPENFNMPYLAVSPVDFWRRWHITLSNWLRDYLYYSFPMRREHQWDRFRNAAATALLGGLWHGAGWTFVCWGALHGLGVCASHWWTARRSRLGHRQGHSMPIIFVCWLTTYIFICTTWVLFRSQNFAAAVTILGKMAGFAPGGVVWFYSPLVLVLPIVVAAHGVGAIGAGRAAAVGTARKIFPPAWAKWLYGHTASFGIRSRRFSSIYVLLPPPEFLGAFLAASWVLTVLLFCATGANPFVYFQF